MQNQPVVDIEFELVGDKFFQSFFNRHNVFAWRDFCTIRDPENMRVDGNRRLAKRRIEYDVGSFATYAWECLEGLACLGDFATMLLEQDAARRNRVLGLIFIETNGFDVIHQFFLAKGIECLGRPIAREKLTRCDIDSFVSCLGRKQYGDEQLKVTLVFKLGRGGRIGRSQARKYFSTFLWIHEAVVLRRARARASAA
jgi:hypothetical protein